MKYRRLGRTDLTVSVVGVGTWQFGGEWGKDFAQGGVDAILGRARDLGINLIDTAECYGDHLSESLVGKAIARDRDHWIVATKFGHRFTGLHQRDEQWSARQVVEQLERSLRALRTDVPHFSSAIYAPTSGVAGGGVDARGDVQEVEDLLL
jgi:myo-inositol catabolism protein IolS